MSDLAPHPQSRLVTWLKANAIASCLLSLAIGGGAYTLGGDIRAGIKYFDTQDNQITLNFTALKLVQTDVVTLQGNIVDLDKRANALTAKMIELHTASDKADAELKARLDTIDQLGKFVTDRQFQQAIPPPYQPQQGPRR